MGWVCAYGYVHDKIRFLKDFPFLVTSILFRLDISYPGRDLGDCDGSQDVHERYSFR